MKVAERETALLLFLTVTLHLVILLFSEIYVKDLSLRLSGCSLQSHQNSGT